MVCLVHRLARNLGCVDSRARREPLNTEGVGADANRGDVYPNLFGRGPKWRYSIGEDKNGSADLIFQIEAFKRGCFGGKSI